MLEKVADGILLLYMISVGLLVASILLGLIGWWLS
jgi:hypothetical protein